MKKAMKSSRSKTCHRHLKDIQDRTVTYAGVAPYPRCDANAVALERSQSFLDDIGELHEATCKHAPP
jgi:hypothetical protein